MQVTVRVAACFGLALALTSGVALAGTVFARTGSTSGRACWAANKDANAFAFSNNTCYRACVTSRRSKGSFVGKATAANHEGSCKKPGYTLPINPEKFYPGPGPGPGEPPPQKPGKNLVNFYEHVPTANHATLIIKNVGGQPATTAYVIRVGDTSYSQPVKVLESGSVTVQPGATWKKEFHQWRAVKWSAEWQ